jgi:cell division protease FtsH
LLHDNIEKLHVMAKLLIKYETIDSDQIDAIMEGREPGAPKDWKDGSDVPPNASESKVEPAGTPADQTH